MSNTPSGQVGATEPMHFSIHTLSGQQTWSYLTLHDEPPAGFDSGWALLNRLPSKVRNDLKSLCADPENTFPAVVNGEACVVIEQEFQASDSGDDWPETSAEAIARLTRSLLPSLKRRDTTEHSFFGNVADAQVTFRGRTTLYLALPADSASAGQVRVLLSVVKGFAYLLPRAA
ncbi:MAG: hypothetical protein V4858_18130 [Pseudomonadota bacterium]